MPSLPPEGEIPPPDGALPQAALDTMAQQPFGVYVHVPFCSSRCGYCDFNTYTATELGADVSRDTFAGVLGDEVGFARRITGPAQAQTVFIGGGTPTLLGADGLNAILARIDAEYGLAPDAEVTTEANPDSVHRQMLESLREGGFTRISFGVQSASSRVLRILDRTHNSGAADAAIREARRAGFDHVSADLIIGTPGETDDDVRRSVEMVVDAGVDHVSAYTLIVEQGTPLARRVERGEVPMTDDDIAAHRYELVDALLADAGFTWYETSNWARPGGQCRHNLGYWHSANWWGVGPGAHSHVGGVRWWNQRHPRTYADALAAGNSPAQGREVLSADDRRTEAVMLGIRLREGVSRDLIDAVNADVLDDLAERELIGAAALSEGVIRVSERGRLLADAISRDLLR